MSTLVKNSLYDINPTLAEQWNFQKNGDLTPDYIDAFSTEKVWWKCEKGHEWEATVYNRHKKGTTCPYCTNKKIGKDNNLSVLSPALASEWDEVKNYPLTPYQVALNYSKKVWWTCKRNHSWKATPNSRHVNQNTCPYCIGNRATKENNFAVLYPHLLPDFDVEANQGANPYELLPKSHKTFWWTCEKGHHYDMPVASKVIYENCPHCTGKRIGEDNNLAVLRPELLAFWDKDKNQDVKPYEVFPYSNKHIVHWKCEEGHKWSSSPAGFTSCAYCLNRKVDDNNSLVTIHPLLATEWHPTKNDNITPHVVVPGSSQKVWWECSKCGHDWKASIRNRANRGTGCPECSKWVGTSFSEQSLFFYLKRVFPMATNRYTFEVNGKKIEVDIYIPEINVGVEYDGYYYHKALAKIKKDREKNKQLEKNMKVIRIREKGLPLLNDFETLSYIRSSNDKNTLHESFTFIIDSLSEMTNVEEIYIQSLKQIEFDILKDSPAIYELMNLQEQENSIGTKYPHILDFWDNEKNHTLSPFYFKEGNKTVVHWKCENRHEWQEGIQNVVKRKHTCTTCHSFGYNYPHLLTKWDTEKNTKDPFVVSVGSNQKVSWLCEKGHAYERTVIIETDSQVCPYCSNHLVNEDNCLHATHPELAEEWHPTKNEEKTPFDVTFGSGQIAWWKCKKGHEWDSPIGNRIRNGKIRKCPYCTNQKTDSDNSLVYAVENGLVDKKILEEWDTKKNHDMTPYDVVPGSTKQVWWSCEHNHSWESPVRKRVNDGCSCPTCQSVAFLHPEIIKAWDWAKNKEFNPYVLAPNSKQKVWWTCEHNHSLQTTIANKRKSSGKCPTCQTVGFLNPDIMSEWNWEKNENLFDPYQITIGNCNLKVNWKCQHGHEWTATVYARSKQNNQCPCCQSLGFLNPTLAKELHPTKNEGLNPMMVSVSSGKKVWWKCKKGHEWEATISHRNNGTGCPHCPKGKVTDENRLSIQFPQIALDWNFEKNEGYMPKDFSSYSSKLVNWKCHSCDYEWEAKISERTRGWKKCIHCK